MKFPLFILPIGLLGFLMYSQRRVYMPTVTRVVTPTLTQITNVVKNVTAPLAPLINDASKAATDIAAHVPINSVASMFSISGLLDLIARAEANRGYDSFYAGARVAPTRPVSQMTIAQVQQWQNANASAGSASTAVGRYQFIRNTLNEIVAALRIQPNAIFNAALQDQMATWKLQQRGLQQFLSGAINAEQFALRLAQEWAGLPKDRTNVSYYAGVAGNRANVAFADVLRALGV